MELCSPKANYPMKFDIVFKTDSENYQRLDVNITIPAPVGDKIGVSVFEKVFASTMLLGIQYFRLKLEVIM